MVGKVPTLLNTGVALGGEAVGGYTPCPAVGKEASILRNLAVDGDSFFGVGIPAE